MARATVSRALNDVGLATWFGGSLMGAVGLNGAAAGLRDPVERSDMAAAGWKRWNPVLAGAIVAHLVGAVRLTQENAGRVASQRGAPPVAALDAALTVAALVVTAWSGLVGRRIQHAPVAGATEPSTATPPDVADAQRRQRWLQWAVPAVTGAMLVCDAALGEQQRPSEVGRGLLGRVLPGR